MTVKSQLFKEDMASDEEAVKDSNLINTKLGILSNSASSSVQIIDVGPLADHMRYQVRQYTKTLAKTQMEKVRMVGILADEGIDRIDAEIYSSRISETFAQDGISYELCRCSGTTRDDVEAVIQSINEREDVDGVLVFYPIFKDQTSVSNKTYMSKTGVYYKTDDDYLRDSVHPSKDVEGVRFNNQVRSMFRARSKESRTPNDFFVPCTALAVTRILDTYVQASQSSPSSSINENWSKSTVTIINRSEILGRPLAALLALKGATVYSVDEHSILCFEAGRMRRCNLTIDECLATSSVIVTGVPSANYRLPTNLVQDGATIVNVSEFPNVDETALVRRGVRVNYVPQVGKVTVAALEENLIRLHKKKREESLL